jgi:phage FluMu protein Com
VAVIPDVDLPGSGCNKSELYCARCGQLYFASAAWVSVKAMRCKHMNTADPDITPEHALRIQARYALGQRHNPDHDETDYRDQP